MKKITFKVLALSTCATVTMGILPSYTSAHVKGDSYLQLMKNEGENENLLIPNGISNAIQQAGPQIPILDGDASKY